MDLSWYWLYDALDKKPPKEEEALAPGEASQQGVEEQPLANEAKGVRAAMALQHRIGNKAMQQLLQQKQAPAPQEKKKAPAPTEVEEVDEVPLQAVIATEEDEAQEIEKAEPEPEQQQEQAALEPEPKEIAKDELTSEDKLAVAVADFFASLLFGGDRGAWATMEISFSEAAPEAQNDSLDLLVKRIPRLDETPKKLFMQNLMMWRKDQTGHLAESLWLRLSRLGQVVEAESESDDDD